MAIGIITFFIGIMATVIIGLFPNPIRDFFIEKWGEPLKIKPSSKEILFSKNGDNWNEQFFVYLINNTNHTYYDINIISEFPDSIDISILPESPSEFSQIGQKNAGFMIGSDFIIGMKNEEKGTKITQTVINNVGPDEKKKIKVIINKNNYNKDFSLKFKVSNFNRNPKPIFNK